MIIKGDSFSLPYMNQYFKHWCFLFSLIMVYLSYVDYIKMDSNNLFAHLKILELSTASKFFFDLTLK